MRWLTRSILFFVLLLILLLGTLAGVLATERGLHFVLQLSERLVPGFSIQQVTGGWRNLTLNTIQYQMPGVTVKAGSLRLALDPTCLIKMRLCVDELAVKQVDVVVDTQQLPPSSSQPEPQKKPISQLKTPYPIQLQRLLLEDIQVQVDNYAVTLAKLVSGAQWESTLLTLLPTTIDTLTITLPPVSSAAGEEKTAVKTDKALGETLHTLFAQPLFSNIADFSLPLEVRAEQLVADNLTIATETPLQITHLLLSAVATEQLLQLQQLKVESPLGEAEATGKATLGQQWPVELTATAQLKQSELANEKITLKVTGSLKESVTVAANLTGPIQATLAAKLGIGQVGLPLSLKLQSDRLHWPLTGESEYQVAGLQLTAAGKATDYTVALQANVSGKALPKSALTLSAKGNEQHIQLDSLQIDALQGKSVLTATLDWSKAISWQGQLTLSAIDTAKQWPDWPATLQGKIATKGSIYGGNWQLALPEIQLNGTVQHTPFILSGALNGNAAGQWQVSETTVQLGKNNLHVQGELSDKWQLDATINAPDLKGTIPGLAGVIKGDIQLRGDLQHPQLTTELNATGINWQGLTLERLKLQGNVSSAEEIKGTVALEMEGLQQESLQIKQLALKANGSEKQHTLSLTVNGEPVSANLALTGGFERQQQRWQGVLSDTHFSTEVGEWKLQRNINLLYRQQDQMITLSEHCWLNPYAELCIPQTAHLGKSGDARVVLRRFDLAMLAPLLPKEIELQGSFTGQADLRWQEGQGVPQAKVNIFGHDIGIKQHMESQTLPIQFDRFDLQASTDHNRANLDWQLQLTQNGQFSGNIQVADPVARRAITGNIRFERLSLALLQPLLMQGEVIKGLINGELHLAGNVQRPTVTGQLALTQFDIDSKIMPFDIEEGQIRVNFHGTDSNLDGVIRTTQGQLNLTGEASWQQLNAWRAKVVARGDKLRLTIPPMARLDVSPDIQIEATPDALNLQGQVTIPWARITVQEVPESAVAVSTDEVMLDNKLQPIEPKSPPFIINSNLMLHVGDNVRLDAFGLKAKLKGDLKVVQDKKGLGLNGEIQIPSGGFHAYGQDLIIRKGLLIFSGPPDKPILDIEAIRNPESTENDVTAGVKVTGVADHPKLDLFSTPAMSQQEALSYLLRGEGLDAEGDNGDLMTSMLIGMGVAKSGKLVGQIGEAFGVRNFSLDTKGAGEHSQLVVSGYILSGLQVKYGVGIFDSLATLTLRYRLMPKLYLEAVSGIDQTLDLLYQFEF